jgi:hypothetical protein
MKLRSRQAKQPAGRMSVAEGRAGEAQRAEWRRQLVRP